MAQFKKYLIRISSILLIIGGIAWNVAGCAPQEPTTTMELFSATPDLTATPTIDWFPATATPLVVRQPTLTPNAASNPVYGPSLFADTFAAPESWQNSQDAGGSIIVKDNVLTLAVKATRGSLLTLRKNTELSDFYLETTLKRVLCKDDDLVGVVFRTQGAGSFYRLVLNCQGLYALQQVSGGSTVMLVNWSPSAEITTGLWKAVTIGISANGKTIRIYMNNKLQAEATRTTFARGGIGYYAHAAGDTPLTVSFSDLNVYQVGTNGPIPANSPIP